MSPPEKKPPRPRAARGGQSFDGSSATIEDKNSNASTERQCSGCGCVVTNHNLGGHGGKSALSGMLWCDTCTSAKDDFLALSAEERKATIAAWQAEAEKKMKAAIAVKIAEFDRCDSLLVDSLLAFREFRAAPHYAERQHRLLLLIRECFRDVDFIVRDWYRACNL